MRLSVAFININSGGCKHTYTPGTATGREPEHRLQPARAMGCCNHGNACSSPSASLPSGDQRAAAISSPHLSPTIFTLCRLPFVILRCHIIPVFIYRGKGLINIHALCSATRSHLGSNHHKYLFLGTEQCWRNSTASQIPPDGYFSITNLLLQPLGGNHTHSISFCSLF